MIHSTKPLLRVLRGETVSPPPIWLMRQAGRHLPEYRAVRAEAGSFLDLCLDPPRAAEVTLQPVRRYAMDAAILFADILTVPFGLGQGLTFQEGEGPKLTPPVRSVTDVERLDRSALLGRVAPVAETVRLLAASLPPEVTLIGFAGAPWTVAAYMVEGGSTREFEHVKAWAFSDPDGFGRLIDLLVDATVDYLMMQIEAGAEAVQLFDSWAGVLPPDAFTRWVIEPNRRIAERLRLLSPTIPVIAFPRMAGEGYARFAAAVRPDGLCVDQTVDLGALARRLPVGMAVQGNLDPLLLIAGGAALDAGVDRLMEGLVGRPHVLNLGHGVLPQTPPTHVVQLIRRVRER